MANKTCSRRFTVMGDLDGMTIRELIDDLEDIAAELGDDAYVNADSEWEYNWVGQGEWREYFSFWKKDLT